MFTRTASIIALLIGIGCLLASCRTSDQRIAEEAMPPANESREPAPPLRLRQLIQTPSGVEASWESLRGNVVLLEFWATWCAPCIAAIPHLNDLAETFADEPIVFLSITSEENEPVERFLERQVMKSWIGFDDDGKTHGAYGVRGIPQTVIVDQHGRIAAVTDPTSVTEETIRNVLEGRDAGVPERPTWDFAFVQPGTDPASDDDVEPILRVIIRESVSEVRGTTWRGSGGLTAGNVPIRDVIPIAYSILPTRIDGLDHFGEEKYTIVVSAPRGDDAIMRSLLRQALESTFRYEPRREQQLRSVLEISVPAGGDHKLIPSESGAGSSTGILAEEIRSQHVTLATFLRALEPISGRPLLDETGLDGNYDITLRFDIGVRSMDESERIGHITTAMREQLGLELVEVEREIGVLVIEPKEAD